MAKVLKKYSFNKSATENGDERVRSMVTLMVDDDLELKHDINLAWLLKKVIKEAKYELVRKNKQTIKVTRLCIEF